MKKWLKECTDTHEGPCKPTSSSFIPTRLLNVGTLLDPILRLELRGDIADGTKYFTLSHCWGPIVPKRLLLENLSEFRKNIPTEGLSKTFEEAIYATRVLEMRYIWIDSLCIIQNSAGDWQEEAKMMGQVYASGLCNLAATAASEGSQGLFLDKLPTPQVMIEINDTRDLWHLNENPGFHWPDILNFAPLNWRGWVFQERFLSTRVIHFGRSRVYWECGKKKCCEWTGHTEESELIPNHTTGQAKSYWQNILNGSKKVDKDEAVNLWNAITDHYSSHSAFTYVTDKLLAIGGLAARVQESTKSRYFAGLWKHDMPSQLLWDVGKEGADESPASSYVASSWSWASVHVPIGRSKITRGNNYTPLPAIEILNVDIDLVTGNEFGQVKGGSMTLAGRLGLVENIKVFQAGEDSELRFEWIELRLDRKQDPGKDGDAQLYLLLVEDDHKEESYQGAGLALQHIKDEHTLEEKNVFKRIGFFQFWKNKNMKDAIGELQDNFDNTRFAKDLPITSEYGGKPRYIVKLI